MKDLRNKICLSLVVVVVVVVVVYICIIKIEINKFIPSISYIILVYLLEFEKHYF